MSSFWEHRPFWLGGDFDLPSTYEEASYDLGWHMAAMATVHGLHARNMHSGFGALRFINVAGGELAGFYRPGQVVHTARATHVTGSAMTLTEAAWFHRWRVLRAAGSVARFVNPVLTAAWLGYELYHAPAVEMNVQQRTRFDKVQAQRAADRERYG